MPRHDIQQVNPVLDTAYELSVCIDCRKSLTIEEDHFYEYRCEECESKWAARLDAWRKGAPDSELDRIFG